MIELWKLLFTKFALLKSFIKLLLDIYLKKYTINFFLVFS